MSSPFGALAAVWMQRALLARHTGMDIASEALFRLTHRPGGLLHPRLEVTRHTLAWARDRAVRFLERAQRWDGSFRDFLLDPGASSAWITAHVALVVESMPELQDACAAAARHLHELGCRDGGWGYNRRVGFDCDSTAQALLVLHRHGYRIRDAWIAEIAGAQSPCGGFPTYRPTGPNGTPESGWQAPHPDVTLVVVRMMDRMGILPAERARAAQWLTTQAKGGIVPAYWWTTPAYGLWAQAQAGFEPDAALQTALQLLPSSGAVPDLPMLLVAASPGAASCNASAGAAAGDSSAGAAAGDSSAEAAAERACQQAMIALLSQQRADGSWDCAPRLRVTDPDVFRSSVDARGRVYSGQRRVFSTAHAIAALVQQAYLARGGRRG
jgi:hypothetical protein